MREFQMKKIIATAVAMAFAAPVMAADITITGDQEFSWQSNNGATTASLDGDVNVKAATETANGLSVSADININEVGGDDGGASLTIKGAFGSIDLGDTSSAVDAVDDATDWGYVLTSGSPNSDASVLWTLPSMVPGLTVYVSTSADGSDGAAQDGGDVNPGATSADGTDDDAHTGYAVKYSNSGLTIGYGQNDYDFGNDSQVVSVSYSMGGLTAAIETHTATSAAGAETDTETVGVTYTMGDLTAAVETLEDGTQDLTTLGVHYGLGGGVTAFIETTEDDNDDTAETMAVGVTMKF
jgi:hypothetical protein